MVYAEGSTKQCGGYNWANFHQRNDVPSFDTYIGQPWRVVGKRSGSWTPHYTTTSAFRCQSFVRTDGNSSVVSEILRNGDSLHRSDGSWGEEPKSFSKVDGFCLGRLKLALGSHFGSISANSKIESLLKLFAHSLHLVLRTVCLRKRRRDRECLPQDQEEKPYLDETVLENNNFDTDLLHLVQLPPGLGYEEWLASHTIEFFHHVNLLYGTICEFCTLTTCPDMMGPCMRQYLWFDEKGKKARIAAPQYIDYVMTFTQNTVNDETIFPTKFDSEFPVSFESIVKKIHRLLFHVLAHLYHSHFREVRRLNLHTHINCVFAHLILFSDKFKLLEEKETEILKDLINALKIFPENLTLTSSTDTNPETTTEVAPEETSPSEGATSEMQCDIPESTVMTLVANMENSISHPGYPIMVSPTMETIDTRP